MGRSVVVICVVVVVVAVGVLPRPTWTDWTSECMNRYPASCRCTWSSGKRLADCQKSNMNTLPILSNDIQILDMTGNKLSQIQDNAFTHANLINLQKLYLKSCRITRIHELALNNLRILIEVDLSHNEIESVDPIVFSTNVRLRVIKLNNNKLHTVKEFPVLEYLNTLDLSHNSLTNFSQHAFTGLRNLKVLDLSYNLFSNLNPQVLPRLSSLLLRGNAWVCDCELKPLRDYVVSNKFYEPDIKCSEPLSLFNSQWDGFEELSCKPEIIHILANGKIVDSIVAMENTLVLSCVVRGDPPPDVKWVKNGRVVQESIGGAVVSGDMFGEPQHNNHHNTVMVNLTVSKHDNEFVCVGSNSGGVVERNLTVTVDEAGLSGFVVFKDGGMIHERDRSTGNLLIYLVIAVVFVSLLVGLVVGGVCVWRWGARGRDRDGVVKGVVKTVNGDSAVTATREEAQPIGKDPDPNNPAAVDTDSERPFEQMRPKYSRNAISSCGSHHILSVPLLKQRQEEEEEEEEELAMMRSRPTPDLLISGADVGMYETSNDHDAYTTPHFPADDEMSVYDNYALTYKPGGSDALRRLAFLRNNNGRSASPAAIYSGSPLQRPSSVCSEPRGSLSPGGSGTTTTPGNETVIIPHGYVTLPRRSMHQKRKPSSNTLIKYDNLGPRTTADGSSRLSLNNVGVDGSSSSSSQQPPVDMGGPVYGNVGGEPLYSPQVEQQQGRMISPIVEVPNDEIAESDPGEKPRSSGKYRPVPPPKPKKKKRPADDGEINSNGAVIPVVDSRVDDDDGTEV